MTIMDPYIGFACVGTPDDRDYLQRNFSARKRETGSKRRLGVGVGASAASLRGDKVAKPNRYVDPKYWPAILAPHDDLLPTIHYTFNDSANKIGRASCRERVYVLV